MTIKKGKLSERSVLDQSGNVFFALFGAVGLVGVLGASTMTVMKGPVRSMSEITKRTVAENNMIASGKLALIAAANQTDGGDCDADGMIEPVPYSESGTGPTPTGGGYLPASIGAAQQDPWGNTYGYCVWNHGPPGGNADTREANCGGGKFLEGTDSGDKIVLAVISSGPNRQFEVGCQAGGELTRPAGSDDIVMSYTYAEAVAGSGGLWTIDSEDADTAQIAKDLSVRNAAGDELLRFDREQQEFSLGAGGMGSFPKVKADFIEALTSGSAVEFISNIKLGTTWLSGDGGDEGIQIDADGHVSASGNVGATGQVSGGSLHTGGALTVTGESTLGTVTAGNTTASTLTSTGLATLNSASITTNLGVSGLSTLSDVDGGAATFDLLTSEGLATLHSASITNSATVGGDLGVTGATTLTTMTTSGLATIDTLTVDKGASIVGGSLNMNTNRITSVATPDDGSDAANKAYVDARVAAGTGFVEEDPTIGDLDGGKWCTSDGNTVTCTADPPMSEGDNLGNHQAEMALRMNQFPIKFAGVAGGVPSGVVGTDSIQSGVGTTVSEGAACSSVGKLAKTSSGQLMVCEDDTIANASCSDFNTGALSLGSDGAMYVCTQ